MRHMQLLGLNCQKFHHGGLSALAEAVENGALPVLKGLSLVCTSLGDPDMEILADAVRKGGLPALHALFLEIRDADLAA